jgi:hypothetical protein
MAGPGNWKGRMGKDDPRSSSWSWRAVAMEEDRDMGRERISRWEEDGLNFERVPGASTRT